MYFKSTNLKQTLTLVLLLLLASGRLNAQNLDFSVLKTDVHNQELSIHDDYDKALKNKEWYNISSHKNAVYWRGTAWGNKCFALNLLFSQLKNISGVYESFLVSPCLSLDKISDSKLSFDYMCNSVKGDSYLEIAIIDKDGKKIKDIGKIQANTQANSFKPLSFDIPKELSGIGFIAFIARGDINNRSVFKVSNIETIKKSSNINITASPNQINFGKIKIGKKSTKQKINISIDNFNGSINTPELNGDVTEFTVNASNLTSKGGDIFVEFSPTSAGLKQACLKITAGSVSSEIKLIGEAEEEGVEDKPTIELLNNQYFEQFNGNVPNGWETKGKTVKISGAGRFSSDTGFAVGISTDNDKGYLKQTINLETKGQEVVAGNELECLIHYYTVESQNPEGPIHLALRWIDKSGKEVDCKEKDFINNNKVFFGRMKSYGTLKFRLTCPERANKLELCIEIASKSNVRFDDFSLRRLSLKDRTPLVAILPQYRTITGEVGVKKEYNVAIQTSHCGSEPAITYNGTDADNVLKLGVSKLEKTSSILTTLSVTPSKKGVFVGSKAYNIKIYGADADNTGSFTIMSYFMAAGKKPSIAIKNGIKVKEMKAEVNKNDEQEIEFDIKNVITNVNLEVKQKTNGAFRLNTTQFFYGPASDKLFANKVKVNFLPKKPGVYTATLCVSTVLSDTLKIELKGICEEKNINTLTESFSSVCNIDKRFENKPAWKDFYKFDIGYWKLEGKWNSANDISLYKQGVLYYDEIINNGVSSIRLYPSNIAQVCEAQYSIDGGGHWTLLPKANDNGEFVVNSHRPTLIRIINKNNSDISINKIDIEQNKQEDRQEFTSLEDAMLKDADKESLPILNEDFTNLRHTRILGLSNWQNLMIRGERPFYAWEQKNKEQTAVENEVAQISFFKYGIEDKREHETWLLSPTLSYKKAKSKILTFSLRFANPIENGGELFGFYIISEKDGKIKDQFINLSDYSPAGVVVEKENWYNYRLDLSKIDSISNNIDDKFHIAFSYYSPRGGNETSLNFMIDNITFGRTDLPELSVDKSLITVLFKVGLKSEPKAFEVKAKNAIDPISITLVPSTMNRFFTYTPNKLPKDGGWASFIFKSNDNKERAAMFLIQTPGAEPAIVKVLASTTTNIKKNNNSSINATFRHNNIEINGAYNNYKLYSLSGKLLKSGTYERNIEVSNNFVVLQIVTNKETFTFKLLNEK